MLLPRRRQAPSYPVVPLRDSVVFPHNVVPVYAGKKSVAAAVTDALSRDRKLLLVPQRKPIESPDVADLYPHGVLARVSQVMKLPDGSQRILVEGIERGQLRSLRLDPDIGFRAGFDPIRCDERPRNESLIRTIQGSFRRFASGSRRVPAEVSSAIEETESSEILVDLVAGQLSMALDEKVALLGETDAGRRLNRLAEGLEAEIEVLTLKRQISSRVRKRMEKGQRDYYLQEQVREINRELGKEDEDPTGARELRRRVEEGTLPDHARERAEAEIRRLERLQPIAPEAGIIRTYVEWLLDLPWTTMTEDQTDIDATRRVLDEDHYDMEEPKDRILDYVAVRSVSRQLRAPILCFVGPPGTGKTSLGASLGRALGRRFVRISLGGVRDEAEIRGHRRTYVGAMPGKIIQGMRRAGAANPVFLLDEIDKMTSDFRGDPASAMLEVLDPEQNVAFQDHYLEIPFDLSNVIFVTTANGLYSVPYPLRDRMEIIDVPGYSPIDKERIARSFLVPKQLHDHGLDEAEIKFRSDALKAIIHDYTLESGVRELERSVASIIRKLTREAISKGQISPISRPQQSPPAAVAKSSALASGTAEVDQLLAHPELVDATSIEAANRTDVDETQLQDANDAAPEFVGGGAGLKRVVSASLVRKLLGKPRYHRERLHRAMRPGLAYGMAWTERGGMLLPVEAVCFAGTGALILTGSLGDVMKESARAALSYLQTRRRDLRLPSDFAGAYDIHVHIPEGAIPKDGPSAGITVLVAMLSALTGRTMHDDMAMTGEITLTGRLLPVGGIKEKVLAAHRHQFSRVLLPLSNAHDRDELPDEVKRDMAVVTADSIDEALGQLFPPDAFAL